MGCNTFWPCPVSETNCFFFCFVFENFICISADTQRMNSTRLFIFVRNKIWTDFCLATGANQKQCSLAHLFFFTKYIPPL